jgi:hypothetical protein
MLRWDLSFPQKTAFAHGRATLAAIYQRRVRYLEKDEIHNVGLKFLIDIDELGFIPNNDVDFPDLNFARA